MGSAPTLRLNIKRPISATSRKDFWAPVGDISLWQDASGKWSGRCRIFFLGFEFHVFEHDMKEDG